MSLWLALMWMLQAWIIYSSSRITSASPSAALLLIHVMADVYAHPLIRDRFLPPVEETAQRLKIPYKL
jgi:hypothetical protein